MPLDREEIAPLVSRVVTDTFFKRYDGHMMLAIDAMKLADLKHALIRNLIRALEAEIDAQAGTETPVETVIVYGANDGRNGYDGYDNEPDSFDR